MTDYVHSHVHPVHPPTRWHIVSDLKPPTSTIVQRQTARHATQIRTPCRCCRPTEPARAQQSARPTVRLQTAPTNPNGAKKTEIVAFCLYRAIPHRPPCRSVPFHTAARRTPVPYFSIPLHTARASRPRMRLCIPPYRER